MTKVSSPSYFSDVEFIASFTGKSYEEAIKLAHEWSVRTGAKLISYYEQVVPGKSILVSYKQNENSNQ